MLLDTYVLVAVATRGHADREPVRAFMEARSGLYVSALTRVEFLGWADATPGDLALRAAVYGEQKELPVNDRVLDAAAELRRRRRGLKTPDAVVAATALAYGLPVVTANVRDFEWIEELTVIDPTAP